MMSRTDQINIDFFEQVESAVSRYGDHEGIDKARILRWMVQFEDKEMMLAAKVLEKIRYYPSSSIRAMTRELCRTIIHSCSGIPLGKIALVPIGKSGNSSEIIMRAIRDERAIRGVRILQLIELSRLSSNDISQIIFIDDFSGTGSLLKEWWETIESLILPLNVEVAVAVLVLNYRAESVIRGFSSQCLHVDYLEEKEDIFSPANREFSLKEKGLLKKYCEKTACTEEYLYGRGKCGLLLCFKHGCPNNSLPILWYSNDNWVNLFKRRAI